MKFIINWTYWQEALEATQLQEKSDIKKCNTEIKK